MTRTSKWRKVWILCCLNDDVCMGAARLYKDWYEIPDSQCFTTFNGNHDGFTQFDGSCGFSQADHQDKLIIISHGNTGGIQMLEGNGTPQSIMANELGIKLCDKYELALIGLITVKSCKFGLGNGLEDLLRAYQKRGGLVGAIKGYKGLTETIIGAQSKPRELITQEGWNDIQEYHAKLVVCEGPLGNDSGRYRMVTGSEYGKHIKTEKIDKYVEHQKYYDSLPIKMRSGDSTLSSAFNHSGGTPNNSTNYNTADYEANEPFYFRFFCCFTQCINPFRNKVRPEP